MPVRDYQANLLVQLADADYAALYLKVSLDETLKDGDWKAFRLLLESVVEARQTTTAGVTDPAIAIEKWKNPNAEVFCSIAQLDKVSDRL